MAVIPNGFDQAQPLRAPFAEYDPVARRDELWANREFKSHERAVAGAQELAVEPYDAAGLLDRPQMEHGFVSGFDGRGMRENEDCGQLEFDRVMGEGNIEQTNLQRGIFDEPRASCPFWER